MKFTGENNVLLYCSRIISSDEQREHLSTLIKQELQWGRIVEAASANSLAPVLYHNLKASGQLQHIPDGPVTTLKEAYYGNVARNMHLFTELNRTLEAFRQKHVDVMLLKGAALANTVYGDIGLRSMSDIDLLVREPDLVPAKQIMTELGYRTGKGSESESWYRKHHFHLPPFMHPEKTVSVEIHWNIANRTFPVSIRQWWDRAGHITLNGSRVLIPSPEDMLLHLCLHQHHQMYSPHGLKRGMCDMAETIRFYNERIQWEQFERNAVESGLAKTVYSLLYLINRHIAPEKPVMLHMTAASADRKFIEILENRLVHSSNYPGVFMRYYAAAGMRGKAATLFTILFPDREEMAARYAVPVTSKKLYLHYCTRTVELAVKYWKDLFPGLNREVS